MQYSQEHLKTMVYAEFGGQTECIMGNSKIENSLLAAANDFDDINTRDFCTIKQRSQCCAEAVESH